MRNDLTPEAPPTGTPAASVKIIPVIHVHDAVQAVRNAEHAFDAGCDGVMLIQMEGRNRDLPRIAVDVKRIWPDRKVGLNLLGCLAADSIRISIDVGLDMTWTDRQLTHGSGMLKQEAGLAVNALMGSPGHMLFTGVAFKHQPHEPDPARAAHAAHDLGFVATTSGPATGVSADPDRLRLIREALGPDAPLAVASGVTPDNVHEVLPWITHALVSTGVSASFHEFDPARLRTLRKACGG